MTAMLGKRATTGERIQGCALAEVTGFHLPATRNTHLVAQPGNLLFEIGLSDENSLSISYLSSLFDSFPVVLNF